MQIANLALRMCARVFQSKGWLHCGTNTHTYCDIIHFVNRCCQIGRRCSNLEKTTQTCNHAPTCRTIQNCNSHGMKIDATHMFEPFHVNRLLAVLGAGLTVLNINASVRAVFCSMCAYWSLTCKGANACVCTNAAKQFGMAAAAMRKPTCATNHFRNNVRSTGSANTWHSRHCHLVGCTTSRPNSPHVLEHM